MPESPQDFRFPGGVFPTIVLKETLYRLASESPYYSTTAFYYFTPIKRQYFHVKCMLKNITPKLQTNTTWRFSRASTPSPASCNFPRKAIGPRRVCSTEGRKDSAHRVGEGAQVLGVFTASVTTGWVDKRRSMCTTFAPKGLQIKLTFEEGAKQRTGRMVSGF